MKTLIKRPNYTLSIKTSCYSAFSFYTFFRNDRIPALSTATLLLYCLASPTATLINLLSFLTEAFLFCLIDRQHEQLHYQTILIALLTARTNSFTDRTYFRPIYRRERTSPLLYIQTKAELKLQTGPARTKIVSYTNSLTVFGLSLYYIQGELNLLLYIYDLTDYYI